MNFDGRVEPGWDAPLRELLDGDPAISVATGLLLRADGEAIEAAGLEIAPNTATYGRLEGVPRAAAPHGPIEVTAASGALMMVRRDEFLALGGFYEPLFMYGEEADYCLRAPAASSCTPAPRSATTWARRPGRPDRCRGSTTRPATGSSTPPGTCRPGDGPRRRRLGGLRPADARAGAAVRRRPRRGARLGGGLARCRASARRAPPAESAARRDRLVGLREAMAQQRRLGRV